MNPSIFLAQICDGVVVGVMDCRYVVLYQRVEKGDGEGRQIAMVVNERRGLMMWQF